MVGNSIGSPPAAMMPRATDFTSSGCCRWQGLKSLVEVAMPITGRSSDSGDRPLACRNARRRNRENSRSP